MRSAWYNFWYHDRDMLRQAATLWQRPRPKYRVVDCNGKNPDIGYGDNPHTNRPKAEFYTWEEAVIFVNDHSLHIVEEK